MLNDPRKRNGEERRKEGTKPEAVNCRKIQALAVARPRQMANSRQNALSGVAAGGSVAMPPAGLVACGQGPRLATGSYPCQLPNSPICLL